MNRETTLETRGDSPFSEAVAWLDHEASLLEILAYRLAGLTNVLRSNRHAMVCTAASDVEVVHDQLIRAAVHRDMALLELSADGTRLPRLADLERLAASEAEAKTLRGVRERIRAAVADVERAREACAASSEAYRPPR